MVKDTPRIDIMALNVAIGHLNAAKRELALCESGSPDGSHTAAMNHLEYARRAIVDAQRPLHHPHNALGPA